MADVYYGAATLRLLLQRHAARGGILHRKCNTNLAMIACVLQDSPGKMLTFTQLMKKLEEFVTGDRKSFENNIRVCLSTSKCFVKIPMYPRMPCCKLNYWKLDHSQITAKMVRRHFRKILGQFPELVPKMAPDRTAGPHAAPGPVTTITHASEPEARRTPPARCGVKFRGPFSIESLLRRDSPSARGPKAPLPPPPPPPTPHRPCPAVQGDRRSGLPGGRGEVAEGWLSLDPLPVETLFPGAEQRWPFFVAWRHGVDPHGVGVPGAGALRGLSDPTPIRDGGGDGPVLCVAGQRSDPVTGYTCDLHHFRL